MIKILSRVKYRMIAVALGISLICPAFSACSNQNNANEGDYLYSLDEIVNEEFPQFNENYRISKTDENYLITGYSPDESGETVSFYRLVIDKKGELVDSAILHLGNRDVRQFSDADSEGNLYILMETLESSPILDEDPDAAPMEEMNWDDFEIFAEDGDFEVLEEGDGDGTEINAADDEAEALFEGDESEILWDSDNDGLVENGVTSETAEELPNEEIAEDKEAVANDKAGAEQEASETIEEPKNENSHENPVPYVAKTTFDTISSDLKVKEPGRDTSIHYDLNTHDPGRSTRMSVNLGEKEALESTKQEGTLNQENENATDTSIDSNENAYTDDYGDDTSENGDNQAGRYFELVKIDRYCEILADKNIDAEIKDGVESESNPYYGDYTDIRAFFVNKDCIYIDSEKKVLKLDNKLNVVSERKLEETSGFGSYFFRVISCPDGEIYVRHLDSTDSIVLGKMNPDTYEISDDTRLPDDAVYPNLMSDENNDFLFYARGSLFGLQFGVTEPKEIIDFVGSNTIASNVYAVTGVNSNSYFAIYKSMEDDKAHLGILNKLDKNSAVTKTKLTIATLSKNSDLEKAAVLFNKTNKEYNISIMNYNEIYGSGEERWDGSVDSIVIEKMNTDIISGKMPDMIFVDRNVPIKTYIGKGLIENLESYIEADPDIDPNDYNQHVWDTFKISGSQYTLVPGFVVKTLITNENTAKGRTKWTLSEATEEMKNSEAKSFIAWTDRSDALKMFLEMSISEFVDWDKGECYFDTEEFRDFIDFLDIFPKENKDIDYNYDVMYRNGEVLAYEAYSQWSAVRNPRIFLEIDEASFNRDAVIIGYPMDGEQGSLYSSSMQLAMSSKTKYKEVCWQFLRQFILEDYQINESKEMYGGVFPVLNSVYDGLIEAIQQPIYFEYEMNGKMVKEPAYYYIGADEIPLEPLTEEETDRFTEGINSITRVDDCDPKIIGIVKEEVQEYFDNKATLDDICKRIQSRVQIYIYETL